MRFYLLIIIAAVSLYFVLKPDSSSDNADLRITPTNDEVLAVREVRKEDPQIAPQSSTTPAVPVTSSAPTLSDQMLARENMTFMLGKLSECTEIKNSVAENNPEPNLSSILDSVQSELGEPVIRSEDWNATEIQLPDGTRRLIRIETVYEDDDIVKKVKYFQIADKAMLPLDLTPEQAVNPSETFIASLEKEGEVVVREHSERVFFQNGEEINYVEKNGRIMTSEIIRAGKSLKCGEYGQKTFRCQCF
ncbi:MAG: hypothetical protein JNL11_04395 [Bdellovibrionaceae bacterium]|nr:hypothetical protein [Pseudobdellovibrionaceae bacterium]